MPPQGFFKAGVHRDLIILRPMFKCKWKIGPMLGRGALVPNPPKQAKVNFLPFQCTGRLQGMGALFRKTFFSITSAQPLVGP